MGPDENIGWTRIVVQHDSANTFDLNDLPAVRIVSDDAKYVPRPKGADGPRMGEGCEQGNSLFKAPIRR